MPNALSTLPVLFRKTLSLHSGLVLALCTLMPWSLLAQTPDVQPEEKPLPVVAPFADVETSEMRTTVERFSLDRDALLRRYDSPQSAERRERLRTFYEDWTEALTDVDFDRLGLEGQIDYVLLQHELRYQLYELDREARLAEEMRPFIPFAPTITRLFDAWRADPAIEPRATADTLAVLVQAVAETEKRLNSLAQSEKTASQRIAAFPGGGRRGGPPGVTGDVVHVLRKLRPAFYLVDV